MGGQPSAEGGQIINQLELGWVSNQLDVGRSPTAGGMEGQPSAGSGQVSNQLELDGSAFSWRWVG